MKKDDFGDRMKMYEKAFAGQRLMPLLPAVVRLDGKGFSRFTRGLKRPYDERMSLLMLAVTKRLLKETNALIGYTQSDEISLLLYSDSVKSQIYFDGRVQKIVGDLAALASLELNRLLPDAIPEKAHLLPRFDCRVWSVPTLEEAANAFLWREKDASKNSVSMAARAHYSHKELHGKSSSQMQDMLHDKGINWNDYPAFFKRGVFIRMETENRPFSADEIEKLPPKHEARRNPDLIVERQILCELDMPPFSKVTNRVAVLFDGQSPVLAADD